MLCFKYRNLLLTWRFRPDSVLPHNCCQRSTLQALIHVNVTVFPRTEAEDTGQRMLLWEPLTFGQEGGISSQHYMKIYNPGEAFIIKGSRKNSLKG